MIYLSTELSLENSNALERCILAIAGGDGDSAMAELYKKAKDAVYGYALSMLMNTHDAEDVMHDCFVSIYRSAERYKASGTPMAWILTITRNLCMDKLRARKRMADAPEEDWEQYLEAKEGISVDDKVLIEHLLKDLSEDEREIVLLHAVSGLKHREIAEITRRPLPTILSKYRRALKKLSVLLESEERNGKPRDRKEDCFGI